MQKTTFITANTLFSLSTVAVQSVLGL